jgi:Tol biopolymer transport system component
MRMSSLTGIENLTGFPALSRDGRYLAYVHGTPGDRRLTVLQVATGSTIEVVAPSEVPPERVTFSNDGNFLYYLNQDPDSPNYRALFEVPSLGGTPRKRVFDVDSRVTFSPDGRSVCFRRGRPQDGVDQLVIASLDSGEERLLARVEDPLSFSSIDPVWSPDGRSVATVVTDPTRGLEQRVTLVGAEDGSMATVGDPWPFVGGVDWLPDGRDLVVAGLDLGTSVSMQLWLVSVPDGRVRRITNDLDEYTGPVVSQAGSVVAAVRGSRTVNVWTASVGDGADARQITFGAGSRDVIESIQWGPGDVLVFQAMKDDRLQLWSMRPDGSGRRQITSGEFFAVDPRRAGDTGTFLYNRVDAEGEVQVWRIDIDGSNARAVTPANAAGFMTDVSSDGGSLYYSPTARPGELWAQPVNGGEARRLSDDYDGQAVDSPDGHLVRYQRLREFDGRIAPVQVIIPAEGGAPVATLRLPPSGGTVLWTPDSEGLTFADMRDPVRNVYRQSIMGGDPIPVTRLREGRVHGYRWSRDGESLFIVYRTDGVPNLYRVPAGGGEPERLTQFLSGEIFDFEPAPDGRKVAVLHGKASQDVVLIRDFR